MTWGMQRRYRKFSYFKNLIIFCNNSFKIRVCIWSIYYFAGEVKFEGKFAAPEGKAVIELCGNYSSARLEVNGKTYSATLANRVTVDTIEGENRLNLTFSASLRNMFGPFHCTLPEAGISPYNFRMPDCYGGNEKGIFTEKYVIKPFGMEKITVEY